MTRIGGKRWIAPVALTASLAGATLALAGGGSIFKPADTYPSGDGDTFRITSGDFNRDGRKDLAATNTETPIFTVSIFLGEAGGTFADAESFIGGGTFADIESGRFGEDKNPDLAITDSGNSAVEVVEGNGDGTFDFQNFDSYPSGSATFGVDVAKLPGDKWSDIVAANSGGGVSIFSGKRNGDFEDATNLSMGEADDDVIVRDLNGDDVPDLATSDFLDHVIVRLGKRNGDYRQIDVYNVLKGPGSIAVGKMDGDKRLDLVVSNTTSSDVAVLLGRKDGFKQAQYFDVANGGLGQHRVGVADFDGDGKRDVALAHETGSGLVVMRGRGDGRLRAPTLFDASADPTGLVLGNFRAGGGPDAAIASEQDPGAIAVYINR